MPGSAAPPPDHRHTPGRRSHPATAVQTKTPRSLPRRGTPFGILSASAPWPSDVLSQPLMAAQSGQDTTSTIAWDNAISLTDRVVIQQKCIGDFLTAPPVSQKHQGVCPSRHPRRRRAIARQRDQLAAIFFGEESATNHVPNRIRLTEQCKEFLPSFQ